LTLQDALLLYRDSGIYPFHMPGHKRNTFMLDMAFDCGLDITEIDGFDNLHDAKGILAKGMRRAALLYGSERTFYLINGSTCGILAGITACTRKGDKILMARNCHKSVYNAVKLNELNPVYLVPLVTKECINGSISPAEVKRALAENPDIRLVVVTSPTYEGVVSDIKAIAEAAHRHGVPLLVDEAHGAHFGFCTAFPESSVRLGADIVIHSLHKTLPSPTQTALLHVNGSLVDAEAIKRQLAVFETSSPSYLMMAAIDTCINLLSREKEKLFNDYKKRLDAFYNTTKALEKVKILKSSPLFYDFDIGKIVISVKNTDITGKELKNILLDKYLLQLEMAMGDYALAMTSICDTDEGFERLGNALLEIDKKINFVDKSGEEPISITPEVVMTPYQAESAQAHFIPFTNCEGAVSAEYVYAYPPGVPMLVPGERVTKQVLDALNRISAQGVELKSSFGELLERIKGLK
jgi:arginine decarboxylase